MKTHAYGDLARHYYTERPTGEEFALAKAKIAALEQDLLSAKLASRPSPVLFFPIHCVMHIHINLNRSAADAQRAAQLAEVTAQLAAHREEHDALVSELELARAGIQQNTV